MVSCVMRRPSLDRMTSSARQDSNLHPPGVSLPGAQPLSYERVAPPKGFEPLTLRFITPDALPLSYGSMAPMRCSRMHLVARRPGCRRPAEAIEREGAARAPS